MSLRVRSLCRARVWPLVHPLTSINKLQKGFALLLLLGGVLSVGFSLFGGHRFYYMYSNLVKPTVFEWTKDDWWRAGFRRPPPSQGAEYVGRANLHVFDEWCGGSTASLRNNVHFPLHPHVRTTVKALAVAPQQINYGLRIFGYLHPPTDGEYEFALSSDDNSELWLSSNQSPLNLRLRAWVGKTGAEWTAPGEYDKFINQTSAPIRLSAQMEYFFEVLLKQNDKGTGHVVVAWRRLDRAEDFEIIQSDHISLYVDESSFLIGDVDHIPQTAASHERNQEQRPDSSPDMQREDPRDTSYKVPLINSTLLSGILSDCAYNPSYTIKGRRLPRYQGLHYVHLSYIYPNDHTRLTHLDTETSCYYYIKPHLFKEYLSFKQPASQTAPPGISWEDRINEFSEDNGLSGLRRKIRSINQEDSPHAGPAKDKPKVIQEKYEIKSKGQKLVIDSYLFRAKKRPLKPFDSKKTIKIQSPKPEIEDKVDSAFGGISQKHLELSMPLQKNDDTPPEWTQTFKINKRVYQGQRSHQLNMNCRMTGNIQVDKAEALAVVEAYVDKFRRRRGGWTLERVVNVVMNIDMYHGKRYLLELELRDPSGELRRLSHYIYALPSGSSSPKKVMRLCSPVGFRWTPEATVHFVVPVKDQARWVHLLIKDVEKLVKDTGDRNFNLILTDFNSTDMDIEKALAQSRIPRYQYKMLNGNFERSRGLQEGINLIENPHSIVFLFDLHIRFPPSIIDAIRKHSVEGFQAFAPIVMRLDCGASPADAKGLWEVQGFGLLGIYKSDLDRVGGMNTRDYTDRWGGEDWELLDRILEGGLEVERFYMRNFYHHFHTKRGMWTRT